MPLLKQVPPLLVDARDFVVRDHRVVEGQIADDVDFVEQHGERTGDVWRAVSLADRLREGELNAVRGRMLDLLRPQVTNEHIVAVWVTSFTDREKGNFSRTEEYVQLACDFDRSRRSGQFALLRVEADDFESIGALFGSFDAVRGLIVEQELWLPMLELLTLRHAIPAAGDPGPLGPDDGGLLRRLLELTDGTYFEELGNGTVLRIVSRSRATAG